MAFRSSNIVRMLRPSVVVALLYAAFLCLFSIIHGYSALDFVHLGTYWTQHKRPGTVGYDGQFYYQLARDPLGAQAFMDNVPYRYQRLVFPLVVRVLSLGQVELIPYMLLLVNFLSIVLSVEVVSRLLVKHGLSPWFSLAAGLYYGQTASLVFDTAEPFAYLLVCIGLLLLEKEHLTWAALLMGLATLSRETAILFPLGYAIFFLLRAQWKDAVQFIGLAIVPLAIEYALLWIIFGKTGITYAPPFEHIPFAGMFFFSGDTDIWQRFLPLIFLLFIPTVSGWLLAAVEVVRREWSPELLTWLMNLLLVTFMARLSYADLTSAGRLSSGLPLALLLYGLTTRNSFSLRASQIYTAMSPFYAVTILIFRV